MWQFVIFLKNSIISISDMLNLFTFDIAGKQISILEIFLGFIIMGLVIAVFWKGART